MSWARCLAQPPQVSAVGKSRCNHAGLDRVSVNEEQGAQRRGYGKNKQGYLGRRADAERNGPSQRCENTWQRGAVDNEDLFAAPVQKAAEAANWGEEKR